MQLDMEQMAEIRSLNNIHITWKDYALMLINSTGNNGGLRDIWREKILTSYVHWTQKDGSISEVNVNGLEVLSELPSDFTESVVDDSYQMDGPFSWRKLGRLSGSKRMKVFIGKYPQESISNEAYLCIKHILQHWEEENHLIWQSPLLTKMWKLAQMGNGQCITQDEVLTYLLEKPVDDKRHGAWISAAVDVLMNGRPSDKYEKYWKTEAVDGFPLNASNRDESIQALNAVNFKPESEEYSLDEMYVRLDSFFDTYECSLPMEQQRMNMDDICKNKVLREDVAYSPCWKKIAICVLKNDVSFKFCGFGATLRERQAREEAIAAFDTKQSEKESAKAEALRLAEQIKREKEA